MGWNYHCVHCDEIIFEDRVLTLDNCPYCHMPMKVERREIKAFWKRMTETSDMEVFHASVKALKEISSNE